MSEGQTMQELLDDTDFRSLLKEVTGRAVTWDEFLSRTQPRSVSPIAAWQVLTDVQRCIGIRLLPRDFEGTEFWYHRTHEISDITCKITQRCHAESRLHSVVSATSGQHFLVKSRIEETIAAAQLDGLAILDEDARALLEMGHAPQTATERLVANIFATLEEVDQLAGERFSVELFTHLSESLLTGVDVDSLKVRHPRQGILAGIGPYSDEQASARSQQTLEDVARYLNQEVSGPYDARPLQGLLMSDAFSLYRPLGVVSTQVGRLVSRLHSWKCDLPVLGLLPISRAKLMWEDGRIKPGAVTFSADDLAVLRKRDLANLTAHQTLSAQLALYTLEEFERDVAAWERRDTEMRDILRNEPLLNQRQRSILARALRIPSAEFLIRYHMNNHKLAYTTARRDLLQLMEKGFLAMEQRGKAYVFVRGPKLDELSATSERSRK